MIIAMSVAVSTIGFAEDKFEVKLYVGETVDLDSFLIDQQSLSADEEMEWRTGNERIIDINSSGVITGKEAGKATVYVRGKKGQSRVATIKVIVVSMISGFELKDETVDIRVGDVFNLEYDIYTVDGQNSVYKDDIEWASSNTHIVQVDDNGQIVGVKEGIAKIHAETVDGNKKDTVVINVTGLKEDILIDDGIEEVDLYVGGKHSFKASSEGLDVTLGVEWTSAIDDVLKIDSDGEAEGLEPGQTQVKAATKDKRKFDTIMVNVITMVKSIELNHKEYTLEHIDDMVDLDYILTASVEGMTPFEDGVKWTSSNSGIARVDTHGVVTAKNKGVALITAESIDGGKKAHCSIVVGESDEERKFIVEEISFDNPVEHLFIGEEYELPIVIEPANATELDLKFKTKIGSSSQIKKDDDVYYFTPTIEGKNEVTVTAESGEEASFKVETISPIKGVDINTDELVEEDKVYCFYVGQKMLLNPVFELKSKYSQDDIHEKGVTWTVDDKKYLDIKKVKNEETEEDEYFIIGKKRGTTTLKVKSKDGDHEKEIKIKVISSYEKLELIDNVTLPINTELIPDVKVTMKNDLLYELINGVNYELDKEITISKQFVRIADIDEEISVENEIIFDLQKSAINSDNSAVIYSEINEHKSRVSKLKLVRNTAKNGFCEVNDKIELEDVFGENYVVADIDDGVITGKRNGKIELLVTFPGTSVSDKGTYYFSTDLKGVLVVNDSGKIVSVSESGFSEILTDAALKKEMELAIRVEERYGNRSDSDTPSSKYVESIMNLENMDFIPDSLNSDYKKAMTRIELAETFVAMIEYVGEAELKRPSGTSRFKDTTSELAQLSYDLGLLDVESPTAFKPYDGVTVVTLSKAIDRMMIALDAYGYKTEKIIIENDLGAGQKIFVDMDNVSSSNQKYIKKWGIEYGVIEGEQNKLQVDKPLTREKFLYYIYKLLS